MLEPRAVKRKAADGVTHETGPVQDALHRQILRERFLQLAIDITTELDKPAINESIQLCGPAVVQLLKSHPREVLDLAYQKLHTSPFQQVATCWRRLYEDATLWKVVQDLSTHSAAIDSKSPPRRRRVVEELHPVVDGEAFDLWLNRMIKDLDTGMSRSGAPGRSVLFESLFSKLADYLQDEDLNDVPCHFPSPFPEPLEIHCGIPRVAAALPFEEFQRHLDISTTPLIVPGTLDDWPALHRWNDPRYFLRKTLNGHRLVPVELGRSYVDEGWSQAMMPFSDYLRNYLLPGQPQEIGYLAQHDLFAQIPALRSDITIPDYCYTSPPKPSGAAAHTFGLDKTPHLEEPLLNAWLGPKGTRTPLHTDAYHNILCQVVGYKYVRLYSPEQTPRLYPRGIDENGVDMGNTSRVDISAAHPQQLDNTMSEDFETHFPLFKDAEHVEGILKPGDCLYVPLGWWHYVESLTVSFSVSFWWN